MKPILILHTGGTIGMHDSPAGLTSDPAFLDKVREHLKDWPQPVIYQALQPAIDSSAATPAEWQRMVEAVERALPEVAGVVVLHGTDTLAYSAAVLHERFAGVDNNLIITGSMLPWIRDNTDAIANLEGALKAAGGQRLPPAVHFADARLPAADVYKRSCEDFAAFASPHRGAFDAHTLPASSPAPWLANFSGYQSGRASLLWLTPGVSNALIDAAFQADGVVLASFGNGNLPDNPHLRRAVNDSGKTVVNVTQCRHGDMGSARYAANEGYHGLIDAANMTPERCYVRLHTLLACGLDRDAIAAVWQDNIS
ncbi:MAG: asparaginase domain-containing protein [Cardiobacteriaceae bacterium]|nr:asparaginase domain-containing protein [Cardiobacteriaceae bacterium]